VEEERVCSSGICLASILTVQSESHFGKRGTGDEKRPRLFFAGHGDGTLGTDEGADTAALAKVVIDLNVAGLLISGDAEIRAKIAAQVAAAAEIIPKAPARLHDRCLLIKTRFDMVKFFGVLLFTPAPDFQFTWFSHPGFLHLTTESQRTQRRDFHSAGDTAE
jgi:hypothetical protein